MIDELLRDLTCPCRDLVPGSCQCIKLPPGQRCGCDSCVRFRLADLEIVLDKVLAACESLAKSVDTMGTALTDMPRTVARAFTKDLRNARTLHPIK